MNPLCLAGHSKWQNIKHTKMAKDQEKSNLYAKFAYLIRAAVKGNLMSGGPGVTSSFSVLKYNLEPGI